MSVSANKAGAVVVDVHAHLVPCDAALIQSIEGVNWTPGSGLEVDGNLISLQALFHPSRLIAWMDDDYFSASI